MTTKTETLAPSTLRPGLLISLTSRLIGNIHYEKENLRHKKTAGGEEAEWKTKRTIQDLQEHLAGRKAQSAARSCITRVCSKTAFGLLCPEAKAKELEAAIADARKLTDAFNRKAKLSNLQVYVIAGKVSPDDVEAVRAINGEVRGLIKAMEDGIKNLDVEAVRAAANDARRIGTMLSSDASGRIKEAIDQARTAARKIVKAGETAAGTVDQEVLKNLERSRTSFLDMDGGVGAAVPEAEAGRALDLTPDEPKEAAGAVAGRADGTGNVEEVPKKAKKPAKKKSVAVAKAKAKSRVKKAA